MAALILVHYINLSVEVEKRVVGCAENGWLHSSKGVLACLGGRSMADRRMI